MDSTVTLPRIASLVSRNLVPVAGVLLLGWSAPDLLVLYYLDTILGLAVVVLLIARHVTGLGKPGERAKPLQGPLDWVRGAAFVVGRWMVVVVVAMTGFAALFGPRFGGALVVLAYAGASVYFELYPERALQWLNPREARAGTAHPKQSSSRVGSPSSTCGRSRPRRRPRPCRRT
jgi:type IV secretory pathway VirB2 component (pilin)